MNRNQKIAVGCGGLGCLGLIVVGIAGVLVYVYMPNSTRRTENINVSLNSNRSGNTNTNESTNSSTESSSSLSDDDKHKLFQAAGMTQDQELVKRVLRKLGLVRSNGVPSDEYAEFVKDHISWVIHNTAFISSLNSPEKARAYVDEHLED